MDDDNIIRSEFGYELDGSDKKEETVFSNNKCKANEEYVSDEDSILSFLIKFKATHVGPPGVTAGLEAFMLPEKLPTESKRMTFKKDDNTREAKANGKFFFPSIHKNHYNLELKDLAQKILLIEEIRQNTYSRHKHFSSIEISEYLFKVAKDPTRSDWRAYFREEVIKEDDGDEVVAFKEARNKQIVKWKGHVRKSAKKYFDTWDLNINDEQSFKQFQKDHKESSGEMSKVLRVYRDFGGNLVGNQISWIKKYIDTNFS